MLVLSYGLVVLREMWLQVVATCWLMGGNIFKSFIFMVSCIANAFRTSTTPYNIAKFVNVRIVFNTMLKHTVSHDYI